jgi:hypothetical protein
MRSHSFGYRKLFSCIGLFWLAATAAFGQIETGREKALADPFEGSVRYTIRFSGKGAAEFGELKPANRMDMHIRKDDFIIHLFGGQKPKTFLYIGDSNHTYIIDAVNLRAFRKDYYVDTTTTIPVAVPTGTTEMVKNYECKVFKVDRPERITYYYVNDDFRVNTDYFKDQDEAKANFLTEGLGGRIPLKTIIKEPGLTTEIELVSIEKKTLDKENFLIPSNFKLKGRDPR